MEKIMVLISAKDNYRCPLCGNHGTYTGIYRPGPKNAIKIDGEPAMVAYSICIECLSGGVTSATAAEIVIHKRMHDDDFDPGVPIH